MRVGLKVEGLQDLIQKADANRLLARPIRRFFHRVSLATKQRLQQRAPKATGRLAARTRYRLQKRPVPLYSVVTNQAQRKKARYGFILDAGQARRKKSGKVYEFHRLGTGQPTRGWFSGVRDEVDRFIGQAKAMMEEEIAAIWRT